MGCKVRAPHLIMTWAVWAAWIGTAGCAGDEDVTSARRDAGGDIGTTGLGGSTTTGSGGITGSGAGGSTTGSGGTTTTGAGGAGGTTTTGTGGTTTTGSGGRAGSTGTGGSGGMTTTGTGGTTGAGGSGGTPPPTMCTIGPASNGSGSFTQYWFSQGTGRDGNDYRTACGYTGHEPSGMGSDTVDNIATANYFAAIPGQSSQNFDSNKYCGACAQVSNGGKSVIVTIVDECPEDSNQPCRNNPNGHLDLSVPAMNQLGFSVGNPSGTTWKFVPCPVKGNVVVRIKPGNNDQVYIENMILPIKSVEMNGGQGSHLFYGAWQLPGAVAGQTLKLTDISGRVISVMVNGGAGTNQDTGHQFPMCQ
jgi:expansin (peptidoglycan-binding protein)